jgi:hypothetical protein
MGPGQANAVEVGQSSTPSAEFSSNAIVSGYYYDARHRSASSDGEHRLMLAVLKTAISDYLQGSGPQTRGARRLSDDVSAWMSTKSPASGVFAYEEVCENLGIDPDRLRTRLSSLANESIVLRLRSLPVRPADQPVRASR